MSKKELIDLDDLDIIVENVESDGSVWFLAYGDFVYLKPEELKKLYKLSKKALKENKSITE
jgi:hypothetical protein